MAPTKPDHAAHLAQAFKKVDKDGSGKVDKAEMRDLLSKVLGCECPVPLSDKIFEEADKDKSGKIEFKEFEGAMECVGCLVFVIQMRMMFEEADKDKSGKIDKKELQALCQCADGNDHATEIMAKLDTDGDGQVSFEEFMKAVLGSA